MTREEQLKKDFLMAAAEVSDTPADETDGTGGDAAFADEVKPALGEARGGVPAAEEAEEVRRRNRRAWLAHGEPPADWGRAGGAPPPGMELVSCRPLARSASTPNAAPAAGDMPPAGAPSTSDDALPPAAPAYRLGKISRLHTPPAYLPMDVHPRAPRHSFDAADEDDPNTIAIKAAVAAADATRGPAAHTTSPYASSMSAQRAVADRGAHLLDIKTAPSSLHAAAALRQEVSARRQNEKPRTKGAAGSPMNVLLATSLSQNANPGIGKVGRRLPVDGVRGVAAAAVRATGAGKAVGPQQPVWSEVVPWPTSELY